MPIRSVAVYCSSSAKVPAVYFDAARALGGAIAACGWDLVYGGNDCGLMGALAGAARAGRGRVVGITPRLLADKGLADHLADELILTDDMRERKALLEARADAFIALPGGFGTFEEIFEIIVGRQLQFHAKPVILLNIAGYYDPLLAMIQHGVDQAFIKLASCEAYDVCADVPTAISRLKTFSAGAASPPLPPEPSALE